MEPSKAPLSPEDAARYYCRPAPSELTSPRPEVYQVKAVFGANYKLWEMTGTTIRYAFVNGPNRGTDAQRQKVKEAIEEWTWYANVKFELVDISTAQVKIAFDPDPHNGSWSLVGRECLKAWPEDAATMNLGWVDKWSDRLEENERAPILHEFGHVLGMLEEHKSPAAGGISINEAAAIEFYEKSQGWSEAMVREQILDKYNTKDITSFSQVDTHSIMQYAMPRQITGLDHDIDYNYNLSEMDKAYMTIMYPRKEPHSKASEWTFKYALEKAGVIREDPTVADQMTKAYHDLQFTDGTANPSKIRQLFEDWCKRSQLTASSGLSN